MFPGSPEGAKNTEEKRVKGGQERDKYYRQTRQAGKTPVRQEPACSAKTQNNNIPPACKNLPETRLACFKTRQSQPNPAAETRLRTNTRARGSILRFLLPTAPIFSMVSAVDAYQNTTRAHQNRIQQEDDREERGVEGSGTSDEINSMQRTA